VMSGLKAAKLIADSHGSVETQQALGELIDEGFFARHLRRLTRIYRERRDTLNDALGRYFGDLLIRIPSSAGLHVSALFGDRGTDVASFARRALEASVAVQTLRPYYQGQARAGLALGFGAIPAIKIAEGIRRLAGCMQRTTRRKS